MRFEGYLAERQVGPVRGDHALLDSSVRIHGAPLAVNAQDTSLSSLCWRILLSGL